MSKTEQKINKEVKENALEEAQRKLREEVASIEKACTEEVNEVLKKHKCKIGVSGFTAFDERAKEKLQAQIGYNMIYRPESYPEESSIEVKPAE